MADKQVSPRGGNNNPFADAETEFAQLARIWRASIWAGDGPLREIALRDMLGAPVFSIEQLRQKVDAVRGEGCDTLLVDGNMTAREIIHMDALRVAGTMPGGFVVT